MCIDLVFIIKNGECVITFSYIKRYVLIYIEANFPHGFLIYGMELVFSLISCCRG